MADDYDYHYAEIRSYDTRYQSADAVVETIEALQGGLVSAPFRIGVDDEHARPLALSQLADALLNAGDFVRTAPRVYLWTGGTQLCLRWSPPDYVLIAQERFEMSLVAPVGVGWSAVESALLAACKETRAYWGRLFRRSQVGPRHVGRAAHGRCVPGFDMVNFLGGEYTTLFGGIERLRECGFDEVRSVGHGTFVVIGRRFESAGDFLRRRTEVLSKLPYGDRAGEGIPRGPLPEWDVPRLL